MTIPMKKGERVLWTSKTGSNFRKFVLFRDLILIIIACALVYFGISAISESNATLKIVLILGAILLIFPLYNQFILNLVSYTVTTEKIVIKKGIINREFKTIALNKISDKEVKQTIFERMLSTGNLFFYTANDGDDEKIPAFNSIDNPFRIYGLIEEAIEELNERNKHVREDFEYGDNSREEFVRNPRDRVFLGEDD